MLKENQIYTVTLTAVETNTSKGKMSTLKLVIPEAQTIFRGQSFFLNEPENAIRGLQIWLSNIARQNELELNIPNTGHIEYLQEVEGKYPNQDPNKIASDLMIKMLEDLAKDKVTFKCTAIRSFSDKTNKWYTNLVPYEVTQNETNSAPSGFKSA